MEHELEKEFNADDIIENFGELPAEAQARLVARQEANEWAALERMREERLVLQARNQELEALLERRRSFVKRLEQLHNEIRAENEAFQRESKRLLAA